MFTLVFVSIDDDIEAFKILNDRNMPEEGQGLFSVNKTSKHYKYIYFQQDMPTTISPARKKYIEIAVKDFSG